MIRLVSVFRQNATPADWFGCAFA